MEAGEEISAATPAMTMACNEIFQHCCATAVLAMQQIGAEDAPIISEAIDKGQLQFLVAIKSRNEYSVSIQFARPDADPSLVYFYSYKEKHGEVN